MSSLQPSAVDTVVHRWNPSARHSAVKVLSSFNPWAYFDIQNIADHCDVHFKPNDRMPVGSMAPPADRFAMFWRGKLKSGAAVNHLALMNSVRLPEGGWWIIMSTFQYEARGAEHSFFAGGAALRLDADGTIPIEETDSLPNVKSGGVFLYGDEWMETSPFTDVVKRMWRDFFACSVPAADAATTEYAESLLRGSAQAASWREDTRSDMMQVGMALLFLNCKNVVQRDRGRTSVPPKWAGPRCPGVRYKILAIDGRASPKRSEESEATGKKMSLHFVRGHFARYTADKPLFGRYVGQFWIPQHTRGDEKVGTVHKDYSVGGAS